LFLIYQVGVLFTLPMLNGADFVTTLLFSSLGLTLKGYLLFLAAIVAVFALAVALLKRKQHFNGKVFLPVILESSLYALTMGSLIVLLMTKVLGFSPHLAVGLPEQGLLTRVVMSLGAGVYEESVFRLGLLGGSIAAFEKLLGMSRWAAVLPARSSSRRQSSRSSTTSRRPGMPSALGHSPSACWPAWYLGYCIKCADSPSQSTRTPSTTSSY
jgi:lysylphosphatidylglycerol synthetase-like protein (DUF2156 family)